MRQLYNQYSGFAMATALRYVADRDDACDIVQDSFVRIFQSIERFEYRGEGSLKSWLLRIVANEALGFLRHRSGITFTDTIPDSTDDEDPDINKVSDEELSHLIASLPEGYRVVFNLYVMEGKSHREIAAMLGIKEGTSASQLHKAKCALAEKVKKYRRDNQA